MIFFELLVLKLIERPIFLNCGIFFDLLSNLFSFILKELLRNVSITLFQGITLDWFLHDRVSLFILSLSARFYASIFLSFLLFVCLRRAKY